MRLTKHHALGNDFLILLDPGGVHAVDGSLARALCDRRRGIGADGLIHGTGGDGETLTMTLLNADGSPAEMSGNGIRCLAQAEAMRRGTAALDIDIATGGGVRQIELRPGPDERTVVASVDMGPATEYPFLATLDEGAAPLKSAAFLVGNPHAIALYRDIESRDRAADGLEPSADINVEFIVVPEEGPVDMRVVERGVGETEACGSGACAAAWAAREWGLAGDRVTVRMPGGDVDVVIGDTLTLVGPATYVAAIEVDG